MENEGPVAKECLVEMIAVVGVRNNAKSVRTMDLYIMLMDADVAVGMDMVYVVVAVGLMKTHNYWAEGSIGV
jgi:hypothetical protein